jgi:hypothetical protein
MNDYLPVVIDAKYIGGYQIEVEFSNSERRLADCEKWLNGEIFQPLRDQEYFQKFFVDGWTIAWPNGADIAPETLYEEGQVVVA